jgi:hypothetical protein
VAVALVTWPVSSSSRSSPSSSRSAQAPFADRNGLVVFEQQPSGMLGTAAPDGGHLVMLKQFGDLQGTDLPVAASDGRHLINLEGQLVTMGPAGPTSVGDLGPSAGQSAAAVQSGIGWANVSFADGGRYVVATACASVASGNQSWVADLIPVAGGQGHMLGVVTDAEGDPGSAAAIVSGPAGSSAQVSLFACYSMQPGPDRAVELREPGRADRTLITAAALVGALGWPRGTPVVLTAEPGPGGSRLALRVEQDAPPGREAIVVITRTGQIVAKMPLPAGTGPMQWSPDGRQIAICQARERAASSVTVWTAGQAARTIALTGRHDVACDQLLWSPDGSQLIYSAYVTSHALTQAASLQHGWTVIDLRSGRVRNVTAPGQPAAWLPGPGG